MSSKTGTNIQLAADFLRNGELVGIPTETVYGLAANALDEKAVMQIFKTKKRPEFDPLIVHISSMDEVGKYAMDIPSIAYVLMEKFWPGPLTILLKKRSIIPDLVTSGLDTVAIRVPNHSVTLNLLKQLNFPLAAPSANPFGYISPTTAQHVADQLGDKISYILDGGPCHVGIESTIVGFEDDVLIVYRLGGTTIDELIHLVGEVQTEVNTASNPRAPGMLKSHYAPSIPLYFGDISQLLKEHPENPVAILCFTGHEFMEHSEGKMIFRLSPEGNLDEAARNLFGILRELDKLPIKSILAEKFPDEGMGKAINDRLFRASVRS